MEQNCYNGAFEISIRELMKFLNIISDANRLKIICLLGKEDKCVCEIWKDLKMPQNLTSYHLKMLKDFKLLNSKKIGLKVIYQLNKNNLFKYKQMLDHFISPNNIHK